MIAKHGAKMYAAAKIAMEDCRTFELPARRSGRHLAVTRGVGGQLGWEATKFWAQRHSPLRCRHDDQGARAAEGTSPEDWRLVSVLYPPGRKPGSPARRAATASRRRWSEMSTHRSRALSSSAWATRTSARGCPRDGSRTLAAARSHPRRRLRARRPDDAERPRRWPDERRTGPPSSTSDSATTRGRRRPRDGPSRPRPVARRDRGRPRDAAVGRRGRLPDRERPRRRGVR